MYVIFLVPETKGRTLEEMDELFGTTGIAAADNERKVRIERDIGLLALVGMGPADEKRELTESGAEFSKHEEDVVTDLKN